MPRFTIGIPAYNRVEFLRESLTSAVSQTLQDVEVVVSDDGSSPQVAEVVRSFGDRVRYHRNPTNIGMWPNFARLTELATGDYFSWLQDDDAIHRDFARRVVEAFERDERIVFYSGFAVWSPSPTSIHFARTTGPLFPAEWMKGELSVLDGVAAAPIAHFINPLPSPQVAFRTDVIRRAVRNLRPKCDLFNENIVTASVLAEGRLAVDPWVCAVHRDHEQQEHVIIEKDPENMLNQWRVLAGFFEGYLAGLPGRWKASFAEILREIPVSHRITMLIYASRCAGDWGAATPTARDLKAMVIESIPEGRRSEIPAWITATPASNTAATRLKQSIKRALPPRVVRVIRAIRS